MAPVLDIAAEDIAITPMAPGQLDRAALLYVQLHRAEDSVISLAEAVAKLSKVLEAGTTFVLMTHRERLVGYANWMDMGDHHFIRNYVIEESLRGQGLGSAMLARLKAGMLAGKPIRLEATSPAAQTFWRAQGFAMWSTGFRSDGQGA